jgi:hypothetical protein
MKIRVRMEDFGTKEELKAGRKLMREKVKEGLKEAGQRTVLPAAKRGAPAIVSQALTTKAAAKGAFLTTLGPRKLDNITGLLNFGGSPRDVIRPKKKKALRFRGGDGFVVVASIGEEGRPRARYKGKHFLEKAIKGAQPAFEELSLKKVLEAFGTLAES